MSGRVRDPGAALLFAIRPPAAAAGIALLALLAPCPARAPAAEPPTFDSPEDIWRGYDPEALPLDIEVVREWDEGGARMEKIRFTAEEPGGAKVRILAARGTSSGKEGLAAILHIHGGGQTLSLDWVKYWTARGYAALTYDFCGPAYDRKESSDWGPLEHCNRMRAGDGHTERPDPRDSSWFHWTLAARRALTVLARTPGVDRERLGIFAVSVGGTLCWTVAGSDRRVKAAVPIYGCGYNIDDRRSPLEAARRKSIWGRGKSDPCRYLPSRSTKRPAIAFCDGPGPLPRVRRATVRINGHDRPTRWPPRILRTRALASTAPRRRRRSRHLRSRSS